nr:micronemal protein 6-like [Aegilops tauschii subsp. strangulata]
MAAGGRVLLVALLVVACATAVVVVGDTASVCDGISCGMGTCKVPILPTPDGYECDCSPGWLRLDLLQPITPCNFPLCPSVVSCHTPKPKPALPFGKNFTTDPCSVVDCGPEGTCVKQESSPYFHCQCNPGTPNARNDPSLFCTNCSVSLQNLPRLLMLVASLAALHIL